MSDLRPKIYLAGPDVFHSDAAAIASAKKAICAEFGFEGLFPLDNDLVLPDDAAPADEAAAIYAANIAMLDRADAVIANVTPFMGALVDDGTAFEIGYAVARDLPIALYDNGVGDTASKAAALRAVAPPFRDPALTVEDFGLPVNLMLAIAAGAPFIASGDEALPMTDLSRFERAARLIAPKIPR